MTKLLRVLLLLSLISLLLAGKVRADVVPEEDDDVEVDEDDHMPGMGDGARPISVCRAIFLNASNPMSPSLPAGAKANTVIAYQNNAEGDAHTVILVAGYLQPLNNYGMVLQNFSVVRQARVVQPSETVSFRYSFTPNSYLEPGDYNLVLALYYQDSLSNTTYFVPAFNGTVTVDDALGTDPHTVLTYLTLISIGAAVAYYVAHRFGLIKIIQKAMNKKKMQARPQNRVEVGTRGDGYDPDYVSPEHQRYRESLMRKSSASPKKSHNANSPKKKH